MPLERYWLDATFLWRNIFEIQYSFWLILKIRKTEKKIIYRWSIFFLNFSRYTYELPFFFFLTKLVNSLGFENELSIFFKWISLLEHLFLNFSLNTGELPIRESLLKLVTVWMNFSEHITELPFFRNWISRHTIFFFWTSRDTLVNFRFFRKWTLFLWNSFLNFSPMRKWTFY